MAVDYNKGVRPNVYELMQGGGGGGYVLPPATTDTLGGVIIGHTHLVNKQFCFAAGQGHDFTNGDNGTGAVGIASEISSDTAFAVGNGVFNSNGNITRSNAFEVTKDGGIILKRPNGTRYKVAIDNNGTLTTAAV